MDQTIRQRFERWIQALEDFGHRGSATPHEARAAVYLAGELEGLGFAAKLEPFPGSSSLGARLGLHVLVGAAGLALLYIYPLLTIVTGLAALVSLIYEQSTRGLLLGRLLGGRPSQNVVARIPASNGSPARRVVVLGHYDTQRTGLIWTGPLSGWLVAVLTKAPGLMKSPLFPVIGSLSLQPLLAIALLLEPAGHPLVNVLFGLLLLLDAVALFLLFEWARGPFVPGANDNASGTAAALALAAAWRAQPVPEVELVVLLTGCEETGMLGAAAFADDHRQELAAIPTTFLNFDSLGYGRPCFLGREHTLAGMPVSYSSDLITLCREIADRRGLVNSGPATIPVCTDGVAFRERGLRGATIICLEPDGRMPNYHQLSDTMARMDLDVAWQATLLGWDLLQAMARGRHG